MSISVVDEFPDLWELSVLAGFAPARVRLVGDRVEVYDRPSALLGTARSPLAPPE